MGQCHRQGQVLGQELSGRVTAGTGMFPRTIISWRGWHLWYLKSSDSHDFVLLVWGVLQWTIPNKLTFAGMTSPSFWQSMKPAT